MKLLLNTINDVYNANCRDHVLAVAPETVSDAERSDGAGEGEEAKAEMNESSVVFDLLNPPPNLREFLSQGEYVYVDASVLQCRNHPRFQEYLKWVKVNHPDVEDDWDFGDDFTSDPLEDVISFVGWLNGKEGETHHSEKMDLPKVKKQIDYEHLSDLKALEEELNNAAAADEPEYDLHSELSRMQEHPAFASYKLWGVKNNEFEEDFDFTYEDDDPVSGIMHFINWWSSNKDTPTNIFTAEDHAATVTAGNTDPQAAPVAKPNDHQPLPQHVPEQPDAASEANPQAAPAKPNHQHVPEQPAPAAKPGDQHVPEQPDAASNVDPQTALAKPDDQRVPEQPAPAAKPDDQRVPEQPDAASKVDPQAAPAAKPDDQHVPEQPDAASKVDPQAAPAAKPDDQHVPEQPDAASKVDPRAAPAAKPDDQHVPEQPDAASKVDPQAAPAAKPDDQHVPEQPDAASKVDPQAAPAAKPDDQHVPEQPDAASKVDPQAAPAAKPDDQHVPEQPDAASKVDSTSSQAR